MLVRTRFRCALGRGAHDRTNAKAVRQSLSTSQRCLLAPLPPLFLLLHRAAPSPAQRVSRAVRNLCSSVRPGRAPCSICAVRFFLQHKRVLLVARSHLPWLAHLAVTQSLVSCTCLRSPGHRLHALLLTHLEAPTAPVGDVASCHDEYFCPSASTPARLRRSLRCSRFRYAICMFLSVSAATAVSTPPKAPCPQPPTCSSAPQMHL